MSTTEYDSTLIAAATTLARQCGRPISPDFLHRKMNISLVKAIAVVDALVGLGVLGPRTPHGGCPLMPPQENETDAAPPAVPPNGDIIAGAASEDAVVQPADGPSSTATVTLQIQAIVRDSKLQLRLALNKGKVDEYASRMKAGDPFPPIVVFSSSTKPKSYLLADGFHRLAAAQQIGWKEICATIQTGSLRDALLHALHANARHGLNLTRKEKRAAVECLLKDAEWAQWSDQEIARHCGVSGMTVSRIRIEVAGKGNPHSKPNNVKVGTRRFRTRGGKTGLMRVDGMGRKKSGGRTRGPRDRLNGDTWNASSALELLNTALTDILARNDAAQAVQELRSPTAQIVRGNLLKLAELLVNSNQEAGGAPIPAAA